MDETGRVLFRLFRGRCPKKQLRKAERAANKHKKLVKPVKNDCRGERDAAMIGSYIERGGSGALYTRKYGDIAAFLKEIDAVGELASCLLEEVLCRKLVDALKLVPANFKLWEAVSVMFWNAQNVSHSHVDRLDLGGSIVLSFGDFKECFLDLQYLNCTVKLRRRDMYFVDSHSVYHSICAEKTPSNRQCFVFTNHKAVVERISKL